MARPFLILVIALAVLTLFLPVIAWDYTIRASVASNGTQGNGHSFDPSISGDGRYVAFVSGATNLVTGDTNHVNDIFVHDRAYGWTTRVSMATGLTTQANDYSSSPSISGDGRYVAFVSNATNLVAGDTNGYPDVFVHDRQTGGTTRVSVHSSGTQGDEKSWQPSISWDGQYVAFASYATNLETIDTNGKIDVFVHDRSTGNTTRVSVATGGIQGNGNSGNPSIFWDSFSGYSVAFESAATNLVTPDTNNAQDIFVYDQVSGTTRISVNSNGTEGNGNSRNPSISRNGRYVVFDSLASTLETGDTNGFYDVFVHDLETGQTTKVSSGPGGLLGNGDSWIPSISQDGRFVAFGSSADNLVAGDTNGVPDIFVHDGTNGQTTRVSVATGGIQAGGNIFYPSISWDGHLVAFDSDATDLVTWDSNGALDIFIHSNAICHYAVFRPSAYENWIFTDDMATVKYRDHYGLSTDKPLVGDINNDGVMDRAVFRNGNWIMDYSMDGSVDRNSQFGMATDVPLLGYFNRDRFMDRAVFRNGQWIVDWNLDGSVDSRTNFGMAGDIPLAGDIDGDGVFDRSVFRSGSWIVDLGMDGTVDLRNSYGLPTDIPVMGWLDGNTVMDRAAFRNGEWIMDYNMDGSADWRPRFGTAGDKPLSWVEV